MPYNLFVTMGISLLLVCTNAFAGNLEPVQAVPVPEQNAQTPEKIELGKKLFFDRRLSGDGTMSCVTCHDPEKAFTDGLELSLSYPTTRNWRNSPTLVNVAFQKFLFHDGRAQTLEDQALFPDDVRIRDEPEPRFRRGGDPLGAGVCGCVPEGLRRLR